MDYLERQVHLGLQGFQVILVRQDLQVRQAL